MQQLVLVGIMCVEKRAAGFFIAMHIYIQHQVLAQSYRGAVYGGEEGIRKGSK